MLLWEFRAPLQQPSPKCRLLSPCRHHRHLFWLPFLPASFQTQGSPLRAATSTCNVEGCNPFIMNFSILFALQSQTFASAEAKVAFAIDYPNSSGNLTANDYTIDLCTKANQSNWNEPAQCDTFLQGVGDYLDWET
ncbi:hypothetical protein L3Q82_022677, partial [Scortum barcoo]